MNKRHTCRSTHSLRVNKSRAWVEMMERMRRKRGREEAGDGEAADQVRC